jgi:hypothetical protein
MAAADPFNSKSGYTVGIPPVPVIDENGNITTNFATIGNVQISGDQVVTGNITANLFLGNFEGNISGNIVVPGANTQVLYNEQGSAAASPNFTFNDSTRTLTINGAVVANTITVGVGTSQFASTVALQATTNSAADGQVLTTTVASSVCSLDWTVIATDVGGNNRQTSKLFASILGTQVEFYEYGTLYVPTSGSGVCDLNVNFANGNVELTVRPYSSSLVNYKIMVTSYKE